MTQEQTILNHLQKYGSITALEAVEKYRIMRLASRISDLRQAGYKINTDFEKSRKGEKAWARYRLIRPSES